ncbi:hypothetical protein [Pseudobacteroides cellulosolvens]|uniref:Uncharacterized protein n=1 Tax=Pseudobacteroides cellulosolvens ATCC 35603 = DSM 2933 TaxID=398512 RepID=A0A0L6JGE7_9FIRM|nr:hypothetical protein [Pseudobacteroides cellulosolvens]KNY24760.1 hypothetical protein Bccel_0017 [Pseudobacteroides cellulosolvens ATCC 35603 = DSM 2933]
MNISITVTNLERFYFGNAIWNTCMLDDLNPLENSQLKEFHFGGKAVKQEDISVYTKMLV